MALHPAIEKELEKIGTERRDVFTVGVYDGEVSPSVQIDFGNPKGGNIQFSGDYVIASTLSAELKREDRKIPTNLFYQIEIDSEENISTNLKTIHNFNTYKVSEFSKDTLALIADSSLRAIARAAIKYGETDTVLILSRGTGRFIVPTPKEFVGLVDNKNIEEMTVSQKETYEKDDLKVYETPSTVLEDVVRAMDYDAFNVIVSEEIASRAYVIATSSKKYKNAFIENASIPLPKISDAVINSFMREAFQYVAHHTLKSYNHPVRHNIMDDPEKIERAGIANEESYKKFHEAVFDSENPLYNERIAHLFEYIDTIAKKSKENKNPLATILSDKESYAKAVGREFKGDSIVLFDPQAGSGRGLLEAADRVRLGEHIKLWGTELREDIDYSDNEGRINIITGVNSATMSGAVSDTFFAKRHQTAAEAMITWNNPPYSLDDGIAKTTLDSYRNNTMITGLYPTKMRNYLKGSLQDGGLIVDIPAELTGYTEENVPERFLLVFGKKYSKEAEARENGEEFGGVFDHKTNINVVEVSLEKGATHDDLLRVINGYFSSRSHLGSKVMRNMNYFADRDWIEENILLKSIKENTDTIKNLYSNAEKFSSLMKAPSLQDQFFSAIQPLQLARTERVFLDTRFYSETNDYKAYNFNEVSGNVPLLIHYIKTKPKIFEIIEQIAEEQGINLPIDKKTVNADKFVVGERYSGEKTRVATDKLGMIKFHFYPTDFDVKSEMSRENLIEVIKSIYEDHKRPLTKAEIEALDKTMRLSDVMTTKTETVSTINRDTDEYLVQQRECFVLEGDNHSVKLNVSNFDLYRKLEEMGFFDINDYIEVVQLQDNTKERIIKGFIDYIENVTIKDIVGKTKGLGDNYIRKALKEKDEIIKEAKKKGEPVPSTKEIISQINTKLGVRDWIESFFKKAKNANIEQMRPIIEKHLGWAFADGVHTKEGKKKLDEYMNFVKGVFEKNKDNFFRYGLSASLDMLKGSVRNKEMKQGVWTEERAREVDVIFAEMEEDVRLALAALEKYISETSEVGRRLGLTLYYTYPQMKLVQENVEKALAKQAIDKAKARTTYVKAYDSLFSSWERKVANLMEHQITEPENFVEMEDVRTNFMLKKMRTGKTLTFIFTGFLEMLLKKHDMEMYLNSNNIADIAGQLTQHIPIMLPSIRIYASSNKHQLSDDLSFDTMYHTSAVTNPFKVDGFTREIIGGGAEVERLANNFYREMQMIQKSIDKKYPDGVTLEDIERDYKDSPFISMITKAKTMCGG